MPRPEIPPAKLAVFAAIVDANLADPPPELAIIRQFPADSPVRQHFREVMLAGCWLEDQLGHLGCPAEEVRPLCFAHGQMCFGRDPWDAAQEQLDAYKDGRPEQPGPELAARLFNERFKQKGG